ncbi:MAG: DUF4912 domain-containing protein, partial [Thermodesulfobacteriota bacterium]
MRHHGSQLKDKLRTSVRALLGVGEDESLQSFVEQRGSALRRRGTHALRKVEQVLQGLGIAPAPGAQRAGGNGVASSDGGPLTVVPRPEQTKFDLGQGVDRTPPHEHIPWGYGQDRVTAMPVDPERLYVYWEVTDDAIASARAGLGAGGPGAWLDLRVYDVTGRIFDGTNAHGYFDHRVERHDRQWFFTIDRPGSSVIVELGMKSLEGYFVRIARSGRVDFARTSPAPARAVEWMTVRAVTGDVEPSWQTPPPVLPAAREAGRAPAHAAGREAGRAAPAVNGESRAHAEPRVIEHDRGAWEWSEVLPEGFHELAGNGAWTSEVERTSWEAGPFTHAVAVPDRVVVEERPGHVRVETTTRGTRVVYGPWQVTVRGIGARAERRVLARWEITRAWSTGGGESRSSEVWEPVAPVAPGGSEQALRRGASERRFGAASETRFAGGSEVFLLGAS